MGDGIQCAQDVEALSAARGLNENARDRPEKSQKRCQDEMRGIDEENCSFSRLRFG